VNIPLLEGDHAIGWNTIDAVRNLRGYSQESNNWPSDVGASLHSIASH
jgi:hypothetical protein